VSKTYAIGDLHGRHDLLLRSISLIERDSPDGGTFIVLGDFVDRGPESRQIVETLMAGPADPKWRWIVLQGNHEAIMLAALHDFSKIPWWTRNGGGETLRSYGYAHGDGLMPLRVPAEHLRWLDALRVYHQDDHRIYVHAGVPFDQPIDQAKRDTLQWMLYAGKEARWDDAEILPDEGHISGKHIVHGHEQDAKHPLKLPHRTNLDSFAWATGHLAIGVFDDETAGGPVKILDAVKMPALGYHHDG
jgi:serine/threonine protein phosphatase 1